MKVFSNRHKSLSGLTTKSSNTNTGQQIRIMTEETSQGSLSGMESFLLSG